MIELYVTKFKYFEYCTEKNKVQLGLGTLLAPNSLEQPLGVTHACDLNKQFNSWETSLSLCSTTFQISLFIQFALAFVYYK